VTACNLLVEFTRGKTFSDWFRLRATRRFVGLNRFVTPSPLRRICVMRAFRVLAGLCVVVGAVACGGGGDPATSRASVPASSSAAGSPASSSAVVPHEKLAALFPAIPGFKRESDPRGETDTAQNVSRVQADYTQEGGGMGGLSVEMMDMSENSAMLAPLKESLRIQGTKKTGLGTQRVTTVAGFPATEEWTPEAGNGVVSVLVADRFVVTMTGSSVGNVSVIYKALDSIDLKKIAALR
jgi:hypothetical protein